MPGPGPVGAGGADALQLRLPRALHGLRVDFVNSTGTATAADRLRTHLLDAIHSAFVAVVPSAADAAAPEIGGQPRIIPRGAWAGSQGRPRGRPPDGTA